MPSWKDPVRVATTGANIALGGTQTIDGVALTVGDRVLVKDQTTPSENGIYDVSAGPWSRSSDANTSALMEPQTVVRVSEGAVNGSIYSIYAGTAWLLANAGPITLGSTSLAFVQTDVLRLDKYGQLLSFAGNSSTDADIFAISNFLGSGQSSNPQAYLAASLAGYGGICTGVHGRTGNGSAVLPDFAAAVYADSDNGYAIFAASDSNQAIHAASGTSQAINAVTSGDADAINATTSSPSHAAVAATNTSQGTGSIPSGPAISATANATAIYAQGNPAGYFRGDVLVTGDLVLVNSSSGDIAEDFDIDDEPLNSEPGTVLIINADGKLSACNEPYDTRVAGVVSGGGELKPAVVLQRVSSAVSRSPVALLGKVFCKVDASSGRIKAGDLLTTSARQGFAMKASDRSKALGAIIGKALAPLDDASGLIPIMVSLR